MTHEQDEALRKFEEFINDTSDEDQMLERQAHSCYLIRTNRLADIMTAIMVGEYGEAYTLTQDLHQFEEEMNKRDLES